ncbi:MAG: DUF4852 domain-containing protein [Chitinophagales bacterium]
MKNKFIILIAFFCAIPNLYSQNNLSYPEMTEKEGLCYFLKIYNRNPDENSYTRKVDNNSRKYSYGFPNTYTKDFLERTDSYNYNLNKNDEFKYSDMLNKASLELKSTIESLDFNKKFSVIFESKVGEYDFNTNSFPVSSNLENIKPLFSYQIRNNMSSPVVTIRKISNYNQCEKFNEFQFKLNLNTTEASKFIDSRKNINNGYIDRKVYIRMTYSVVNIQVNDNYILSPYDYHTGLAVKAYKIEVWSDKFCLTKKLGEIKISTSSQINTNSNTTTATDKNSSVVNSNQYSNAKAVISAKEDVLYVGINNEINIETSNISIENIDVKTPFDSYVKFNGKSFLISPTAQGNTNIQVFVKNSNKLISNKEFKVTLLPNPVCRIENFNNTIPIESLLNCKKLSVRIENIKYQVKFDIISFDFDIPALDRCFSLALF